MELLPGQKNIREAGKEAMPRRKEFTPTGEKKQSIDRQPDFIVNPLDFFRAEAQGAASPVSRANLLRAVDALAAYIGGTEVRFDSFSMEMVGEWVARLLFNGYSPKTISNNILKRLTTLYNKAVEAGLAAPTEVFRNYRNRLDQEAAAEVSVPIDAGAFAKLQTLVRGAGSLPAARRLGADMLLFAIYMGGLDFEEIAAFKKDDYQGDNEQILEIVNRYSRPRNSYLFPLDQIHSTPRQRELAVEYHFTQALSGTGLTLSPRPADTTFDLWTLAAMSCGISPADIAACLPPARRGNPIATMAVPSEIDSEKKDGIRSRIIATLSNNPLRWYAMHLRRHVDYDMLTTRLRERDVTPAQIYYPMEEIIRKVGHRKIFESKPVIGWLLFFRERVTRLDALFNEIGDLAWGYRHTNDLRSPYAAITDQEIGEYQNALGTLTPDTPIVPDEAVQFNPGDYLVILGGAMNGRHGVFVSQKQTNRGGEGRKIVFRVKLGGDTNANWIVDWDPRLVRKITPAQYRALDHPTPPQRLMAQHQ